MRIAPSVALFLLFVPLACGGSSTSSSTQAGDSGAGGGGDDASSQSDDGGSTNPPPSAGATFGTYIALGDSISDRGGEAPFFYDLLLKNDDATYPTWQGKDLSTKFPGIKYVHGAIAGSISGPYNDAISNAAPKLLDQIKALGSAYPGDVLITITIGGNDLNDHAGDAASGLDTADRMQLATNLKAAMDALSVPGRLGSGKVYIVQTNIYDASDGMGNWKSGGGARCPPFDTGKQIDTTVFSQWNDVIAKSIPSAGGNLTDTMMDLHALFSGHGFNSMDDWYISDCIHPTKHGHQAIRAEMWRLVTGEKVAD
jgi:lysophospholipase L1-like esterase